MTWRRFAFAAAAWLYLAGIVVQVFFAGAALFELTDWTVHAGLGWGLGSAPLLLVVLAAIARTDRRTVLWTAGLTVAALVQPELAAARDTNPIVAAFHPVNALFLFWLAWIVARRSARSVQLTLARTGARGAGPAADVPPVAGPR